MYEFLILYEIRKINLECITDLPYLTFDKIF